MSLRDHDIEAYIPLLEAELAQLPELVFDKNMGGLTTSISVLGDLVESQIEAPDYDTSDNDEADAFMITKQVLGAYNKLKSDPNYASNFSQISACAAALGDNLARTFSTLRNQVKPKVVALEENIRNRMSALVDQRGVSLENLTFVPNFKTVVWNDYYSKLGGWEAIQKKMEGILGWTPSPTSAHLSALFSAMDLNIEQANLDEEAEDDVQERAVKGATAEQKDNMQEAIEMVTDRYTFRKMLTNTVEAAINSTDLVAVLKNCEHVIEHINPCLERIDHTPFNLTSNYLATLHSNIEKVKNAVLLVAYAIGTIDNHFKDAYVMDAETLNGDNAAEGDEEAQQQEAAMKYLRCRYLEKGKKVPTSGIKMEEIKENEEDTEQMFAQLLTDRQSNAKHIRNRLIMEAADEVSDDYVNTELNEDLLEDTTPAEMRDLRMHEKKQFMNKLAEDASANLNSALYNFVIGTTFHAPAVKKVHDLIGPEVVRQMELDPEMTEDRLQLIDATVGAQLISEYIVDHLLTKEFKKY